MINLNIQINMNPKAKFLNCDNHSLNLVGVHAASEHVFDISFSEFLTRYTIFSPVQQCDG